MKFKIFVKTNLTLFLIKKKRSLLIFSVLTMNQNLKISIYSLATIFLLFSNSLAYAGCDITRAVYKDMGQNGFELRFNDSLQEVVGLFATVTLWHPKRGNINSFEVGSTQGFSTIYLSPIYNTASETDYRISAYFFDYNFKEFNQEGASPYMFISGLGSWDWYDNQMSEGRDIVLGNPMWKFDHCR
jgi:hypothetical protein